MSIPTIIRLPRAKAIEHGITLPLLLVECKVTKIYGVINTKEKKNYLRTYEVSMCREELYTMVKSSMKLSRMQRMHSGVCSIVQNYKAVYRMACNVA